MKRGANNPTHFRKEQLVTWFSLIDKLSKSTGTPLLLVRDAIFDKA
uniref:Uncharacterized protein n=1 Tax=Vibrio parahaemolyticus TaxID=670 RepID=A0A1Y1BAA2_VIBPH|nr:hypothetical protein [Vibrio parahaemolyticus]